MRVTAELDEATYEHVRLRARLHGVSMGSLLGELITRGLQSEPLHSVQSGRFTVIAAPDTETAAAMVPTAVVQQAIDREGIL